MQHLDATDPTATALTAAIRSGDVAALTALLAEHPWLARAGIRDDHGMSRTPLHVATDWPGHFPRSAEVVAALVSAGADVDAPFHGSHAETPLHWAASCDDLPALDALLDAGADIDAPGSVLGGGPPLRNATGFRQWRAARRLVERGAVVDVADAAALGMTAEVGDLLAGPLDAGALDRALWWACHGGRGEVARLLVERGADVGWTAPWDGSTPVDAARSAGADEVVAWLRGRDGSRG